MFFLMTSPAQAQVRLITLDPGHFHASLVQLCAVLIGAMADAAIL